MKIEGILFSGEELEDTNVCEGIKVGDQVTFEVTLEATHCVKQRDFELFIGPSGLDEVVKLDVHVICDCDCETEVSTYDLKFVFKSKVKHLWLSIILFFQRCML